METQIFIVKENEALIYDNDQLDEFNSLVNELGLKCNNVKNTEKSPIPYYWLDESTIRAFKLLCPRVNKVGDYTLEIPLEILRHIKLCNTENYFDWIEIWANTKDPDPFCVGRVFKSESDRTNNYSWNADSYLIGRWGAENKSIQELINLSVEIATERIKSFSASLMAKMRSWNECPEQWAKEYIFNNNSETEKAFNTSSGGIIPF